MKNSTFKNSLQNELLTSGHINKIVRVSEIGSNTSIQFEEPIEGNLLQWLNNRFIYGVRKGYFTNCIFVNTPND